MCIVSIVLPRSLVFSRVKTWSSPLPTTWKRIVSCTPSWGAGVGASSGVWAGMIVFVGNCDRNPCCVLKIIIERRVFDQFFWVPRNTSTRNSSSSWSHILLSAHFCWIGWLFESRLEWARLGALEVEDSLCCTFIYNSSVIQGFYRIAKRNVFGPR